MVATDVASRGIGMLGRIFVVPFLFLLPSLLLYLCGSIWIALLSATIFLLVHSFDLGFHRLIWFSCQKNLGILVQCSLLRLSFRLNTYQTGTEADWNFLDLFKLHSQGFPGPGQEAIHRPRCPED